MIRNDTKHPAGTLQHPLWPKGFGQRPCGKGGLAPSPLPHPLLPPPSPPPSPLFPPPPPPTAPLDNKKPKPKSDQRLQKLVMEHFRIKLQCLTRGVGGGGKMVGSCSSSWHCYVHSISFLSLAFLSLSLALTHSLSLSVTTLSPKQPPQRTCLRSRVQAPPTQVLTA